MRFQDIRDGLTNTIMVGEIRPAEMDIASFDPGASNSFCWVDYTRPYYSGGKTRQSWPCSDAGASHATTLAPINYRTDIRFRCNTKSLGGAGIGQPVDPFTFTPQGITEQELREHSYGNWNVSWGFKSRHPGGAQFLYGGGSVHFLPEEINHTIYQYLGCRDDGRHIEEIP